MTEYKIVVIGSGSVGKSALTIQYIQEIFVEKYDATIEDSYRKQIDIDDTAVMLDILDTAGQEEYSAMRDDYMGKGDGFLMVYSITDNQSFYECKKIWEALVRMKTPEDPNEPMPKIPIVLVGNKIDLEDERCVVEEDVQEFIQELGDYCKWFETSALTRHNVDEIFEQVVRLILAAENGQDPNGETGETGEEQQGEGGEQQQQDGEGQQQQEQQGEGQPQQQQQQPAKTQAKPQKKKSLCVLL
mmetsp:Transcript_13465/g.20402  ORF Transcript_13465/g.20402 Transcript_13465/m.20402 type:complete len:244 (-) Transcript_13465:71-802(-)